MHLGLGSAAHSLRLPALLALLPRSTRVAPCCWRRALMPCAPWCWLCGPHWWGTRTALRCTASPTTRVRGSRLDNCVGMERGSRASVVCPWLPSVPHHGIMCTPWRLPHLLLVHMYMPPSIRVGTWLPTCPLAFAPLSGAAIELLSYMCVTPLFYHRLMLHDSSGAAPLRLVLVSAYCSRRRGWVAVRLVVLMLQPLFRAGSEHAAKLAVHTHRWALHAGLPHAARHAAGGTALCALSGSGQQRFRLQAGGGTAALLHR